MSSDGSHGDQIQAVHARLEIAGIVGQWPAYPELMQQNSVRIVLSPPGFASDRAMSTMSFRGGDRIFLFKGFVPLTAFSS
jgi:hypothetical protein